MLSTRIESDARKGDYTPTLPQKPTELNGVGGIHVAGAINLVQFLLADHSERVRKAEPWWDVKPKDILGRVAGSHGERQRQLLGMEVRNTETAHRLCHDKNHVVGDINPLKASRIAAS